MGEDAGIGVAETFLQFIYCMCMVGGEHTIESEGR